MKQRHHKAHRGFGRDYHSLKDDFYNFNADMWVHKLRAKRYNNHEFTYCEPIAIRVYYVAHDGNINYSDKWYTEQEPISMSDFRDVIRGINAKEMMPIRSLHEVTQ